MLTPQDFVRQVYLEQTGVRLDFHPKDDKYKEVIEQANMHLHELQQAQDWSWLKNRVILGITHGGPEIPEWELPREDIYKVSTQRSDCIKLHRKFSNGALDETGYTIVPWESVSSSHRRGRELYDDNMQIFMPRRELTATFIGNTITFNRPLRGREVGKVATTDVVMRLKPLHICDDSCSDDCDLIEKEAFELLPDPGYMVLKIAAIRAEADPTISPQRMSTLADRANKMLSAMRENDTSATMPEFAESPDFGYIEVT